MRYIALLLFMITISAASHSGEEFTRHLGKWKSNEEMTLKSMRTKPNIPEKMKSFFSNNFFGKLVHEVKKDTFSSYFQDDDSWQIKNIKYDMKLLSSNKISITYKDKEFGLTHESTLVFEGDCYYTLVSKYEFKEYFCRVRR